MKFLTRMQPRTPNPAEINAVKMYDNIIAKYIECRIVTQYLQLKEKSR